MGRKSAKKSSTAVVIGVGSIGQGHLRFAIKNYARVVAVDIDSSKLKAFTTEFGPGFETHNSLEDFLINHPDLADWMAVVSTLGPDHFLTVKSLLEHGAKKIYLEKPVTNSISTGRNLVELSRRFDARLLVGFGRRHSGFISEVKRIVKENFEIGPSSIVVHGGAIDMSTNGIHWVDFACALFSSLPYSVIGGGSRSEINPRSRDLFFWEGSLTWEFEGGRRLSVVLDNASSVEATATLYCRNGVVIIGGDSIDVRARLPDEVSRYPSVTRYGTAYLESSTRVDHLDLLDWRVELFEKLEGDKYDESSFPESVAVTESMLAGLWALENKELVTLPVQPGHSSFSKEWGAS
jgi:predicted dehydrogenase